MEVPEPNMLSVLLSVLEGESELLEREQGILFYNTV